MDFVETLKRIDRDLYDSSDKAALPKLARLLDRSKGMTALLKSQNAILDSFATSSILKIQDVYTQYEKWKTAFRNTKRNLATSKLILPDTSLSKTCFPHELSALERVAKMCQRSGYADVASWQTAIDAHLELWNACVKLAMNGSLSVEMKDANHADAAYFEPYLVTNETIAELKNYTWLGARRGEKAGVLNISLTLPHDEFVSQAKAHIKKMGLAAQSRDIATVVEELVGNNIEVVVKSLLDSEAASEALQTARDAYVGLLSSTPVVESKVLSVYVGSSTDVCAVVSLEKNGKPINAKQIGEGESLIQTVESILNADEELKTVVLPVAAGDGDTLREISDYVDSKDDLTVIRILPAGLAAARDMLNTAKPIASALVLAFRAIRPVTEWAKIPASTLGLGEFTSEIDEKELDAALVDSRLLLAYMAKRSNAEAMANKTNAKKRPLNPLVRTIRDLKPGMTVDGVVTNLTKFGAFVNVGLATEAMIHVSQLSTDFIEEPSQVVSVGQTVNARVLEVIPEKGRIALSLKPAGDDIPKRSQESKELQQARANASAIFTETESSETEPSPSSPSSPSNEENAAKETSTKQSVPLDTSVRRRPMPPSHGKPPGGDDAPKKSRSEALADLNALFKK